MAAARGEAPRVSIWIKIAALDRADDFQSRLFGNEPGSVKHVRNRCRGNTGLACNVLDTHTRLGAPTARDMKAWLGAPTARDMKAWLGAPTARDMKAWGIAPGKA